ncbi:NAD-dependent epimerase/dehydratase family protein [uncultured Paraglaciecola sp.]|uniref:NAD-dependent epimerase/dehydratase family protein n=1 Tax=uncultured Paraglaciecola sp. TaxID=1765024 RepID=UPI00344FC9D2
MMLDSKNFKTIVENTPLVSIDLCIISDSQILLGKRNNQRLRGMWFTPGDNYHPDNSHVIPALINRFHEAKASNAKAVIAWGTGSALREFLHVDDMATASIHVMNLSVGLYQSQTPSMLSHINVGSGTECSIKELTETIADVVGFRGVITWDKSKPDGAPRKFLDSTKLNSLGWQPKFGLRDGLIDTYNWYLNNLKSVRK